PAPVRVQRRVSRAARIGGAGLLRRGSPRRPGGGDRGGGPSPGPPPPVPPPRPKAPPPLPSPVPAGHPPAPPAPAGAGRSAVARRPEGGEAVVDARIARVGAITIGSGAPLALIAGPCVIESRDAALRHAERLRDVAAGVALPLVYKSSFDKANRTSLSSFRGVGLDEGLRILADVRRETGLPVLTDVHEREQIAPVAAVVDVLQTPAFLCRQTDFVVAVANAGKPVNLKKGQFLSPMEMLRVVEKARATGNPDLLVTERGFAF